MSATTTEFSFRGVTIPDHTLAALTRYVNDRQLPGRFLRAVLTNDLRGAVSFADPENFRALAAICAWVYFEAPSQCHGSVERVQAWLDRKEVTA